MMRNGNDDKLLLFYIDCFCQNYNYIFSLTTKESHRELSVLKVMILIVIYKLQPGDQFEYTKRYKNEKKVIFKMNCLFKEKKVLETIALVSVHIRLMILEDNEIKLMMI